MSPARRAGRLLLQRVPRLLTAAPLVVVLCVAAAWLIAGAQATTWGHIAAGFTQANDWCDTPGRECAAMARGRQDQPEEASIFAIRRILDGDVVSDADRALFEESLHTAVEAENAGS